MVFVVKVINNGKWSEIGGCLLVQVVVKCTDVNPIDDVFCCVVSDTLAGVSAFSGVWLDPQQ